MKNFTVIAVDGFASTGKSTLSKRLAEALNFIYIDTGYMYRVATFFALNEGYLIQGKIDEPRFEKAFTQKKFTWKIGNDKKKMLFDGLVYGNEIRTLEVSSMVSLVAELNFVREHLVNQQRELSYLDNVVMDGRDIGTVVFPDAKIKFFLIADSKIRAQRRFDELSLKGEKVLFEEVLKNVIDRDYKDSNRTISPLKKAEDAIEIDTTNLSIEEVLGQMLSFIERS